MGFKVLFSLLFVISSVWCQNDFYKVCVPTTSSACQSLEKDGSRVVCERVETRVDCALKLARGTADIGVFSEEELLLLAQQQPSDHRVVASLRNVNRQDPYAFEAVAVVASNHTRGFEGLHGGRYCHPGLDETDLRWSPRVLRALEHKAVRTDTCPGVDQNYKTAEELEVFALSQFFAAACRPGPWSANSSIDASLKREFPSLCSLCGDAANNPSCSGYAFDMGVAINGVNNNNRHIQSLECLTRNGPGTVAFVAWQHVREFFTIRSPSLATSYSILCEDETLRTLTSEVLSSVVSPCSLVKQHYGAVVATSSKATTILNELRTWWPNGSNPGGNGWQSTLFEILVGGTGLTADFQDALPTPANYTSARALPNIGTTGCMSARRWCTVSEAENNKCSWVRQAAYVLGLEPQITCQQRQTVFQCLEDIRDSRADFVSLDSNYGYLARQHYKLSPVKLLQNSRNSQNSLSRVTALVKETTAQSNVTRFENLRGKRACFPEFSGIAYVTFVRAAHERSVISASECDYARAVGEFFTSACAPGAIDASHALGDASKFNATTLCTACRPTTTSTTISVAGQTDFTCAWDYTNAYFGTNGSLACLAEGAGDIAFLETQNIEAHMRTLNLQASDYRVLCRNNTLASTTGVRVDDNCLLALVVDGEVLARRNDPLYNSLSSLLDLLDQFFGYNAAVANQLINLEIYSPFDGVSDLLFKDSAIGLTEPSSETTHEPAKNYFDLFKHLESCTGGAAGLANKGVYSFVTLILMSLLTFLMV